jgi:hypothetical protein
MVKSYFIVVMHRDDTTEDTTLFLSTLDDLYKCVATFDEYSKYSRMKLNISKSTVIPLGAACEQAPPHNFSFKYLPDDETERLLGVPVSRNPDPDSAWDLMISKLAESMKHWSCQRLSIFGRIHAARNYIGSKTWYLATVIPPKSKCLKRLSAMIWKFLFNNKNLDIQDPSNRYYAPWPKTVLIQPSLAGGLHAQDFESQLCATLAKWIFKLVDPRHLASWKSFPFHFFDELFPGQGCSIFIADPIIVRSFGADPDRWPAYVRAWLLS